MKTVLNVTLLLPKITYSATVEIVYTTCWIINLSNSSNW